jgi:hypothetical protein
MVKISWNGGLFNTALGALLVGSPGMVIGGLIGAAIGYGARRSARFWASRCRFSGGFISAMSSSNNAPTGAGEESKWRD